MSFYYLATPYSKYPNGINAAFEEAARQAAVLLRAGVPVFCPIAHTHPVAIHGDIDPLDHEIWLPADKTFMDAAKGIIVCEMEGWQESYGVNHEIEVFRAAGKPIIYMTPGEVPGELTTKRVVVGLCGYAGSGKDEAAKGLLEAGFTRVALADAVRDALVALNPEVRTTDAVHGTGTWWTNCSTLVAMHGWDVVKKDSYTRQLLQRMGTEAGRDIHGADCWVNIARKKIEASPGPVVVTDVRFESEVALIREYGGTLIRITRPGVGPVNEHVSESYKFDVDAEIVNDGTSADLHAKILEFAEAVTS